MDAVQRGLVMDAMSPQHRVARAVLRDYVDDVISRYHGRPATSEEIMEAVESEPDHDLELPDGVLIVARTPDRAVGCAGLRLLSSGTGEVTRVFVVPEVRRRGVATRLLASVEAHARQHGVRLLRLDTRRDLVEARRLYGRHGYEEVAPFNAERFADVWLEKHLT